LGSCTDFGLGLGTRWQLVGPRVVAGGAGAGADAAAVDCVVAVRPTGGLALPPQADSAGARASETISAA
jgi:hypothetical protein